MKKKVGTTITYDISWGEGKLLSLYGIQADIQNSYNMIEKIAARNPYEIIKKMNKYDELIDRNYELFKLIKNTKEKNTIKKLLKELDKTFLNTLCYYLFFVYLGYAGESPHIKSFLRKHGNRFHKIRLYTIDVEMNKQFPKLFGLYNKKLTALAPFMWRGELIKSIEGKRVDLEKIKNRKKKYLVITKAGKTKEYLLSEIDKVLDKELTLLKVSQTNQVKGSVACQGKAKGSAVLVFSSKDYKKIKQGDILITPMTKPEITPYLKRVLGIVTNDGGALSHASIISREMDLPCIVGTKIATDIFKDGDLIELNAYEGVARKLTEKLV